MNITLNVDNDMLFPIGTHLWVPVTKGWKTFNEVCPVCDGSKKITVKGFEVPCGYCSCGSYSPKDDRGTLTIRNYQPEENIIYGIELRGTETKGDYKSGGYPPLQIKSLSGFCRSSDGLNSIEVRNFQNTLTQRIDRELTRDNVRDFYHTYGDLVYTSKALALKAVKALHEYQRERLVRFNAEHGTAYEYPWEY